MEQESVSTWDSIQNKVFWFGTLLIGKFAYVLQQCSMSKLRKATCGYCLYCNLTQISGLKKMKTLQRTFLNARRIIWSSTKIKKISNQIILRFANLNKNENVVTFFKGGIVVKMGINLPKQVDCVNQRWRMYHKPII